MTGRLVPTFAVLCYAVSYPIGSLAVSVISPFSLIALRFGFTAVLLWSFVWIRRAAGRNAGPVLPRGRRLWSAVAAGLLVHGVQFLGLYWAMAHGVGPGVCALVIAMNPVATALMNRLLKGAPENRWGCLALAAGTVGVVFACLPRLVSDPGLGAGFTAALVALLGLTGGSLLQGRRLPGLDPITFTAIGVTASLPAAVLLALTERSQVRFGPAAIGILCLLVVTSALGTALYAATVQRFGARGASVLFAVIPAVAAVAAWFIQGSAIGVPTVVGLALGALACVAQVRASRPAAGKGTRDIRPTVEPAGLDRMDARHRAQRRA